MFVPLFFLLVCYVGANNPEGEFLNEIKGFLLNPTPDDQVMTDAISDIDPTPVNGLDNLEFPPLQLQSSGQLQNEGFISYTCTYDFVLGAAPYRLRPGTHDIQTLGVEPSSGSLKIETQEGCLPRVWKLNQRWETFGRVKRESATVVLVEWPTVSASDKHLQIYLPPIHGDLEPCTYNLQSGGLRLYKMALQTCENQIRLTKVEPVNREKMIPEFRFRPDVSFDKVCKYSFVMDNENPYWLLPGDYRIQKKISMRTMLHIKTRKECAPRVLTYETTMWKPFGTVTEFQSRQPTDDMISFVIDWWTPLPDTEIVFQMTREINGKKCFYKLIKGMAKIELQHEQQKCDNTFSFL